MHALGLSRINYPLLVTVAFTLLIPTLYNTFRITLIADIPNVWGFNIASQIAWLNIIYEVLQEGITLPLFFVLGAVVHSGKLFREKMVRGIRVIVPLYTLIALIIWFFAEPLVVALDQQPELVAQTAAYIRLESVAIPLRVLTDIALIALITLGNTRFICVFLIVQLIVRVFFDYLFISGLGLGVIGIGYSTIAINFVTSLTGLFLLVVALRNMLLEAPHPKGDDAEIPDGKRWIKVSLLSGAESGVRNIAFVVMILKLVNEIGESGVLWVTNAFIWGWLLLPILALGSLIKQDVGIHRGFIGDRFKGYMVLSGAFVLVWFATIPLWGAFIQHVMGISNAQEILSLAYLFLPFYVIFAANNVLDSYFYGMGRTDLMLYQSLIVNGTYYVCAFVLYQLGIFEPTLRSIALLFGFGIVLDFVATVVLFRLARYPRAV